jgi:hypothetical protein
MNTEGGSHIAETKVLKQLVRDHIDPKKDLGHSDRHGKKKTNDEPADAVKRNPDGTICEDCKS